MKSKSIEPASWLNIEFHETGIARLVEVSAFLESLPEKAPEHAAEITAAFIEKMDYLDGYGRHEGEPPRYQVNLARDWAEHSFSIVWLNIQGEDKTFAFQGGLIWHGGCNETFTVSLSPQWWGIHT